MDADENPYDNPHEDFAGPIMASTSLGLRRRTLSGIDRLAAREGITRDEMIDRLLSVSTMVADEAERGRFLCFARLDQERGRVSDASPLVGVGSKPWSLSR